LRSSEVWIRSWARQINRNDMFSESNQIRIEELRKRYPTSRAMILPVLWIVQEQEGYISEASMKYVASLLHVPYGHILGVVTFYTMLKKNPPGKHHIEVCTNISCMLRGSGTILNHLQKRLGISVGETSPDKKWTLEESECMGSCGTAPMLAIGDETYENLTIEKIDKLLDTLK
jgi:NADH-quinone oxidoreductase E subunit